MSLPLPISECCQYCENTECSNKQACKEFYRYLIYDKIRKLENELYCLTSLFDK